MIAARGRNHAANTARARRRCIDVDEPAAHLEGADRRVVLVLDPDLAAAALVQQRPALFGRRRIAS